MSRDAARPYYPTLPSVLKKFDRLARRDGFRGGSREEFALWRDSARDTLRRLLALDKMEACPLGAAVTERKRLPGMVREHLVFNSEPEVRVSAYLLIPDGADAKTPIFVCPHGHGGYGKEGVAGAEERPGVGERIERYHCDYGRQLARLGYVAFCPDARGAGERREEAESLSDPAAALQSDCRLLAHMGAAVGIPAAGMLVWDLMRGIDYLCERGEWNTHKILGCGFSGGGMQILYAAAADPRLQGVMTGGYFYGFRDSLVRMNGNCCCNYVPGLMEHFDMGDLAAMICPRRLVVQSGRRDPLNGERGIENVTEQIHIAERAWRAAGEDRGPVTDFHDGGHIFCPDRLSSLAAYLAE